MITATAIADEIGHGEVIVNHRQETYIAVGVTEVDELPTVKGYSPLADVSDDRS